MIMAKEFLPLFLDFNETTQDLTDEQCGRLIRALVDYANGKERKIDGMELLAFRFLKGSIDRNEKLSAIRAEAGAKGGRPKNSENQIKPNENKENQTKAKESKPKQNDINNNNNNDINNEANKKKFTPPTIEEIRSYCLERRNSVDPERFHDFYASKGWKVGNQPMKDWKAAVRTWERTEDRPSVKALPAQGYHQRDYTKAQDDAFDRMMALAEKDGA
jgi:hypothetical protein